VGDGKVREWFARQSKEITVEEDDSGDEGRRWERESGERRAEKKDLVEVWRWKMGATR
jgi:hypothetical protein